MIYDISRALTPRTAVFPGDTSVVITPVARMCEGASCNVTAITMSAHAGTHVDAPRHYFDDGYGVDAISLDVLIGRCRVVTILDEVISIKAIQKALSVMTDTLNSLSQYPTPNRLIIHTRSSETPNDVWDANFAHFEPDAADWLGEIGVRLIGTDAPSVDPATSKALPAHKMFLKHDIIIVENLCLLGVPDGEYELIALPVNIYDNDAAPARVVLRSLSL
jgi:arylformamidase